jgi:N-acetylglucosaminyldiphosphoundecaprenol N-acetyl-beta-D-mannosaminyltransferase
MEKSGEFAKGAMTVSDRVEIAGVYVSNLTFAGAIEEIERLVREGRNSFVVTPNADHVVRVSKNQAFAGIYAAASLVLADGMILLWAARFLGTPLLEKVSGSDLFPKMCEIAGEKGYRLFFLGGRPGAAALAAEQVRARYSAIRIVGLYSPPFGFENDESENEKIVGMIKAAQPDILFVGLGSPKQEKWISRYKDRYQAPVSIGIGVSFEFVAGMVRRAPVWMQRAGLEWLWRLGMEPGRLWKRYLIDDIQFFRLVVKQKLERKTSEPAQ